MRKTIKKAAKFRRPAPPDKLWKVVEIALADLKKAESSTEYDVHMNWWHKPNGSCTVCLAGSVMAFTLGVPKERNIGDPCRLGKWADALYALDYFRKGDFGGAYRRMHGDYPSMVSHAALWGIGAMWKAMGEPHYNGNKRLWWTYAKASLAILKGANV